MKVTINYIAEKAGVSKSTVSRVINKNGGVSKETKKKVMEVVNKYNYQPAPLARGLVCDLSHTIGLVLPRLSKNVIDPFFLEFLHGVGNTAADCGFSILLPADKNVVEYYSQIDGLIVVNPKVSNIKIDHLQEKNISFVFLGRDFSEQKIPWVDGDNIGGSYEAVKYLIDQGHEEIAYITGDLELVVSHLRLAGYRQALFEFGLALNSSLVEKGDFTWDSGYQAVKKLLARDIFFTAVFAANDVMAMGAIKALKDKGIKVPGECAVMGFDGVGLGSYIEPQLTTMRQPIYQLGEKACEMLITLIRGEEIKQQQKVFPIKKLIRESV